MVVRRDCSSEANEVENMSLIMEEEIAQLITKLQEETSADR